MKKFYELCPYCEQETKMVDFRVQKCEHCGRYVVPCAICPTPTNCKTCPLCAYADNLNEEIGYRMVTIERMVDEYNCNPQEMDFKIEVNGNEHRFALLNNKDNNLTLLYDKVIEGNSYVWFGLDICAEDLCSVISSFVGKGIYTEYKVKLKEKV